MFDFDKMIDISTDRIKAYIVQRQDEEASNATINRELSCLGRMFTLGLKAGKASPKPYIPMLKENNVRTGFFEWEDFFKLEENLPIYLKSVVTFAYYTGWRSDEIRSLKWKQVDLSNRCVRLEPGTTKNNEGRVIYLSEEISDLLSGLWKNRRLDSPWVFQRNGQKVGDFRKSWASACEKAKIPGMMFYDFRRTAVRNLIRAGIPERVAMQISGHKTRSVFDRYHIVNESDLKEAALKIEKFSVFQKESKKKVASL